MTTDMEVREILAELDAMLKTTGAQILGGVLAVKFAGETERTSASDSAIAIAEAC